jgi:hypothetical protein
MSEFDTLVATAREQARRVGLERADVDRVVEEENARR